MSIIGKTIAKITNCEGKDLDNVWSEDEIWITFTDETKLCLYPSSFPDGSCYIEGQEQPKFDNQTIVASVTIDASQFKEK